MCHPYLSLSNIDLFILWRKLSYFAQKKEKKEFPATWSRKRFGKFPKKLPHFEEKRFLIHQDFWRIWADFVAFF
jgi:hypothetical protein